LKEDVVTVKKFLQIFMAILALAALFCAGAYVITKVIDRYGRGYIPIQQQED